MKFNKKKTLWALSPVLLSVSIGGYQSNHFYRASAFFGEPRFEKPWLQSTDLTITRGSSHTGLTCSGKKTCPLNSWGYHNMQALGARVPNLNPANPYDAALIALTELPQNNYFGHLSLQGDLSLTEATISCFQNLTHGFFGQLYLPLRSLSLKNVRIHDCSPCTGYPNAYTPEWQFFLQEFNAIMKHHAICLNPYTRNGCGETALLIGWTRNYEETETFDYFDVTAKTGIILSTAPKTSPYSPLMFSLGYDNHTGIPLSIDCSWGLFEWFTAGAHFDSTFFLNKKRRLPIKTEESQSGLVYLAHDETTCKKGPLWDVGTYIKIDHAGQALSIILGYSYANKSHDTIEAINSNLTTPSLIQSDERYKGWNMHTLNFLLEYDFNKEDRRFGPRIGLAYNRVLAGKRIIATNMVGGFLGIDIQWQLP